MSSIEDTTLTNPPIFYDLRFKLHLGVGVGGGGVAAGAGDHDQLVTSCQVEHSLGAGSPHLNSGS